MKNNKIVNAFNSIQPDKEVENRIFNKITQKKSIEGKNIMSKKITAVASAAAVLAICFFGGSLLGIFNKETETIKNSFRMVAYAADGIEIGSVDEYAGIFTMITDPETRERLNAALERTVEIEFIGDTIKDVDITTSEGNISMTVHCLDDDGNPLASSKFKVGYPEILTEDFAITATAHFLDGSTETKTIIIPA